MFSAKLESGVSTIVGASFASVASWNSFLALHTRKEAEMKNQCTSFIALFANHKQKYEKSLCGSGKNLAQLLILIY